MNIPALRRAALSTALTALLLIAGACSLLPSPDQVGIPVPIAESREQAMQTARDAVQMPPAAKVDGVERMDWVQAKAGAVSSPQLEGEEPAADRPVWLVTIVTVGEGLASTGGEISQVVVDGIDGRVIAIAQLFS